MPRAQRPKRIPRGTPEEEVAGAQVGGLSLPERYLLEHRLVFLTGNIDQAQAENVVRIGIDNLRRRCYKPPQLACC